MKKVWDTLLAVAIAALVIKMVLEMVRPYMPWFVLGALVIFAARVFYERANRW